MTPPTLPPPEDPARPLALPVSVVWDQLLSVALVGTERKPPPTDALAQVAALLGSVDSAGGTGAAGDPGNSGAGDAERGGTGDGRDGGIGGPDGTSADRGGGTEVGGDGDGVSDAEDRVASVGVLAAAGVVAAYRRVGLSAERSPVGVPAGAAEDGRREVSATAGQLLQLLLEGHVRVLGGPTALIEEWLERCAATGHRPPAGLLPGLLDHATRVLALRPAVITAGGPRAAWLAGQNPTWAWAAEPTDARTPAHRDDEVWRTGEPSARMAVLAARRADDPAAARALVEETWSGETAKDRAQILDAFRPHVGPDDEAFLEDRLDDRAASVRAVAAELLAGLPGSRLGRRVTDRVRPLVTHRRRRLEIALPDQPDAAARRDGIVDAGAPPATGRRTWWLIQLVGATPPTFWTDELGLTPADAVKQAERAEQSELVEGWVLAASRHGDPTWCRELLRVTPDPRLLRALPPDEARDLLPVAMERATDPAVAPLLVATPAPWPELLTSWVVHRLRANRNAVSLDRSLTRLATAGDAAVIPDLERWIDELRLHDRLRTTLRDVAHALSIRHTIAQELS